MPVPGLRFATLSDEALARVRALEQEFGVYILALAPDRYRVAPLGQEQLKKLQALEEEFGLVLLAYQPKDTDAPPSTD